MALVDMGLNFGIGENEFYNANENYDQRDVRETFSLGFRFFSRKFWQIEERYGVFLEPSLNYDRSINESLQERIFPDYTDQWLSEQSSHSISLGGSLGLYHFISKKFAAEITFGRAFIHRRFISEERVGLTSNETFEDEFNNNSINVRFINSISLDQLIRINYFL